MCALGEPFDDVIYEGRAPAPGIYILNGQGVCERHIGAPYAYPEKGIGGMIARYRRDNWKDPAA